MKKFSILFLFLICSSSMAFLSFGHSELLPYEPDKPTIILLNPTEPKIYSNNLLLVWNYTYASSTPSPVYSCENFTIIINGRNAWFYEGGPVPTEKYINLTYFTLNYSLPAFKNGDSLTIAFVMYYNNGTLMDYSATIITFTYIGEQSTNYYQYIVYGVLIFGGIILIYYVYTIVTRNKVCLPLTKEGRISLYTKSMCQKPLQDLIREDKEVKGKIKEKYSKVYEQLQKEIDEE